MNPQLRLLKQLQELDSELRQCETRLREKPDDMARVEEQREAKVRELEERREALSQLRRKIDEQNMELQDREEKIAKLRQQLNTIKTNKEYAAMLTEINDKEADKSVLEDEILEMMMEQDSVAEECKKLEAEVKTLEGELQRLKLEWEREMKEIQARAEQLREERRKLAEQVDRKFLEPYERLLAKKDGIALASAHDQICHGCFMNLTTQTMALLLSSEEPVFCHSCGRLLYLDEEAAKKAAQPQGGRGKGK